MCCQGGHVVDRCFDLGVAEFRVAAALRHHHIEKHEIKIFAIQFVQCDPAIGHTGDLIIIFENYFQCLSRAIIIVYNEDTGVICCLIYHVLTPFSD